MDVANSASDRGGRAVSAGPPLEPLLRTVVAVATFAEDRALTNATGFLFRRDARLFLVTGRHVVWDEPAAHFPDRIEIVLHADATNLASAVTFSMPLYRDGTALWREGRDASGPIDVALLEIQPEALPADGIWCAFTPDHLRDPAQATEIGSPLLIPGFPLGFGDTLHHVPVVRHAVLASSFGLRFQGQGYFLTDARTHRGSSGAPVVLRVADPLGRLGDLPWQVLGVHSARLDLASRDMAADEALGLNCAWYADILMTLSDAQGPA